MSAGSAPRPPALGADGRLAESIACVGCGYDLRGLAPAGACPECGAAAARSLGDRACDPMWQRGVQRGIEGLIWAALLATMLLILLWIGGDRVFGVVVMGLTSLLALVALAGAWRVSAPEPGGPTSGSRSAVRRFAPVAAAVVAAEALALGLRLLHPGTDLDVLLALIARGSMAALGHWLLVGCLADLATRIPDARLARGARRLRALGAVLTAPLLGFGVLLAGELAEVWPARLLPGMMSVAALAGGAAWSSVVAMGLLATTVVHLLRFHRAFGAR